MKQISSSLLKKIGWLVVIGLAAYLTSFWNPFIWDDEQFIYKNQYVLQFDVVNLVTQSTTSGANVLSNYFRPLTSLTFAVDHAIWGLRPFGFHLTNTWLHLGTAVGLLLLLRLLWPLDKDGAPWLDWRWWTALVFAVHPLQTEAVTYINSRGDSLYSFLLVVGLWAFARSFAQKSTAAQFKLLTLALVAYPLAVLAKEIGFAGLALFWLIAGQQIVTQAVPWPKMWQRFRAQLLSLVGLTTLAGFYLFLRATVFNFANSFNFVGSGVYGESLWVRLHTFSKIFFIYGRLFFWPWPLHMERTTEIITQPLTIWPVLLLSTALAILALSWYEWRQQRSLMILFGAGWFASMLAPVSGIIPINGLIYEHWLYLPLVGMCLVLVGIGRLFVKADFATKLVWPAAAVALILIALTIRQNYIWGDHVRFYEYTLQFNPTARVYNNLGMAWMDRQQVDQAITAYESGLVIDDLPQIRYNLGRAYTSIDNVDRAVWHLERALEIAPGFGLARQLLITIYMHQEQYQLAQAHNAIMFEDFPQDIGTIVNQGYLELKLGNRQQAELYFTKALLLSGNSVRLQTQIQSWLQEAETGK